MSGPTDLTAMGNGIALDLSDKRALEVEAGQESLTFGPAYAKI